MILTGFPAPALLYMRMKLLWTLPEVCYILTSESDEKHGNGTRWLLRTVFSEKIRPACRLQMR